KLRASCEVEAVADLLGLASGILAAVEGERSREELAWAARAWAQSVAEVQPLVLVFEDIHWAEEPLLELVEHLAAWVRDASLLLICLARPELLEVRPGWGGGRPRASVMGRIFWPSAVERLAPDLAGLDRLLDDLLLREFVLEEPRSTISGERAYRFKHVLIREVAYSILPKSARAELHEAFAGWLGERAGEELLEVRAYHLEQACSMQLEVDGSCPPGLA